MENVTAILKKGKEEDLGNWTSQPHPDPWEGNGANNP